jgi:hypothetical protein
MSHTIQTIKRDAQAEIDRWADLRALWLRRPRSHIEARYCEACEAIESRFAFHGPQSLRMELISPFDEEEKN